MNPTIFFILLLLSSLQVESFYFKLNNKQPSIFFPKKNIDSYTKQRPILKYKTATYATSRKSDITSKRSNNYVDRFKAMSFTPMHKLVRLVSICILYSISTLKMASATSIPTEVMKSKLHPLQSSLLWLTLFLSSAALHSAESAITKLSPWKVQSFVEDEGPESPFSTLSTRMTTLLSTILIATTACSIYSTALFVSTASELFPTVSLGVLTAVLTVVTLFFGELLPKALAVSNSELVARKLVPVINRMSWILSPLTSAMTGLSELVLSIMGMKSKEDNNVTEDMLRLVVNEAERSEGIEIGEGRMIKGVLDMQETEVNKIMQPRVDVVALPEDASASQILETALATRYSRIPVYKGDIDNISGVVFSKDLLQYVNQDFADNGSTVKKDSQSWKNLSAAELMQPTYFIPESMKAWNALQEMRRRRIHMAIIVDEYGGTSGLVTFEDLLEEVC